MDTLYNLTSRGLNTFPNKLADENRYSDDHDKHCISGDVN